jgi:hypothetical protein
MMINDRLSPKRKPLSAYYLKASFDARLDLDGGEQTK